jgi:hypothetical protein
MIDYDIHSCGYYCNRPACIEAQRNELRDKLLAKEWVELSDAEIGEIFRAGWSNNMSFARALQVKLREKNNG